MTNLENWMYRRDREEYILSLLNIDIARHISNQAEAEQKIEEIMRT